MREFEDHYWWFVSRRRVALSLLQEHCPDGKVLDIGCGTGAVLQELQASREAEGVDFSELALEFGRKRGLTGLTLADAQALPFSDGSFQAVVSLDTLEHVPDDAKALSEMARILSPGGIVILNVPAFQWLWGPHDVALMHHRRYTRAQLKQRMDEAGFDVVFASYGVFFLFPAVVVLRVLDKLRRREGVELPRVPNWLNRTLIGLMEAESRIMRRLPLPWGSSVVAVGRRRG